MMGRSNERPIFCKGYMMIKLYLASLFVTLSTIFCLAYGFIYNDSTIYMMGDIIGIPFSVVLNWAYWREYYEHERD